MDIQKTNTAVVFIDPQNDVLEREGSKLGSGRGERYRRPDCRKHGADLQGREGKRI